MSVPGFTQTLGTSGTIEGTVLDPSGAAVKGATVSIENPVSGYEQSATTDATGHFEFVNVPFNPYHLTVKASGFQGRSQDVPVQTPVPINIKLSLTIGTGVTSVTVTGEPHDLLEQTPTEHTDVNRTLISKLPVANESIGLSDVITNTSPFVAADANGFFHPMGDHAEAQISLDNQPITDQYSKIFSNQIPLDAIQSLEIVTGVAPAQDGDKDSLVINAVSRSGLGDMPPHGSFSEEYGSFGTSTTDFTLGTGGKKWGNFLVGYFTNSSRFLDSPEFTAFHDQGNGEGAFDRVDFDPTSADTLHLNFQASRSWFQIPDTYDQLAVNQNQRQQIRSINIAPGYTHLFSPSLLLDFTPYVRVDHVQYYPSSNPFSDLPATLGQDRRMGVYGAALDLAYSKGIHNAKVGFEYRYTALSEGFNLGVTDPAFNALCVDASGNPVTNPAITNPSGCPAAGFQPNLGQGSVPAFLPGILPFDLTRGGQLFDFHGRAAIREPALYAQDDITLRQWTFNLGLRRDWYNGISRAVQLEPRAGVAYNIKSTNTIIRLSYGRFLETPYNENLVLSSATGAGGLATNVFGAFAGAPLQPGRRDQYEGGIEQAIGRWAVVDVDYFYKLTRNAYDFDVIFNTPLTFPITWNKSKLDGIGGRINLANFHGLTAYSVMGHTRARYFPPETGGVIFNSPLDTQVFRIDHDETFEQSTHVQYQFPKSGPWVAFTWRYDSGLVAGAVPDLASVLALDGDQQATIGFHCGSDFATVSNPITSCNLPYPQFGAIRVVIPAPGTFNPDTNPPRIAPHHLFDIAVGKDNIFHTDRYKVNLQFTVLNLANSEYLYNFLSTFSGTHFIAPRTYQAQIHFVF
ncbi:MAG: TonB-dependent receptor [Terriglobia bacterium]